MKHRLALADYFAKQGFKVGAEIGVWSGYYSEILCKAIPNLKLYCIDSWTPYAGYGFSDRHGYSTILTEVTEKLKPYNCVLIKKFSMDAVKDFKDESLDFVYIDGNHEYKYVQEDIREWTKKVKKGGIVSGHDYYKTKRGNTGVIRAVDEYVKENNLELFVTDQDRFCRLRDDRNPNWYFIRK